jgi:hypothetical protein
MHLAGVSPDAIACATSAAPALRAFETSSPLFVRVCKAIYLAMVHVLLSTWDHGFPAGFAAWTIFVPDILALRVFRLLGIH